jgi:hypothetical protein
MKDACQACRELPRAVATGRRERGDTPLGVIAALAHRAESGLSGDSCSLSMMVAKVRGCAPSRAWHQRIVWARMVASAASGALVVMVHQVAANPVEALRQLRQRTAQVGHAIPGGREGCRPNVYLRRPSRCAPVRERSRARTQRVPIPHREYDEVIAHESHHIGRRSGASLECRRVLNETWRPAR